MRAIQRLFNRVYARQNGSMPPASLPLAPLRVLLLGALALALVGADAPRALNGTQWAQLTVRERLIIRIPRLAPPGAAPANLARPLPPLRWVERHAPRCVPAAALTGAQVGVDGDVDLIVSGTRRLRAKLDEDCPTLDFYAGFYLKPADDGNVCARRDVLRSRSGAHCPIREFKTLVAKR